MKKVYSKPDIFFESFTLNTNIAAGCEKEPHGSTESCGTRWGNSIVFVDGVNDNCNSKVTEGNNQFDNLCYHNPTDTFNVFNS